MIRAGIDLIEFYTPHYYLDLTTLAQARGVDPDKYTVGLGQHKMAVPPPDEDVVTMAANAALPILENTEANTIDMLLFATESGVDQSKSAGIYVHELLNLPRECRTVELKQACYSATAGLQLALLYVRANPNKKVLLIASDIARYGLNTTGESSQGGGAVAMLVSANPRLLNIEPDSGYCTEDAMDFWRPNYRDEALVDGKFSCELYLKLLKETWQQYSEKSGISYDALDHCCFHIPIPRLAEKANQKLAMINGHRKSDTELLKARMAKGLYYSEQVGNCYTASLYVGLLSLLEQTQKDFTGERIGLYSYGSGCVAEYFSATVQPGYKAVLNIDEHNAMINSRKGLSQSEYENFYSFHYPTDGSKFIVPKHETGRFRLARLEQHKRIYEKLSASQAQKKPQTNDNVIHVRSFNEA